MSEKTYWIVLIAVFIAIALLIWLLLVPIGFIEYNLGVNLFTGSIFMVLTIVFLSWFVTLRERGQWKEVKQEVFLDIQSEIGPLFGEMLEFIEDGLAVKLSLLTTKDERARNRNAFLELCKLKDSEKIRLNPDALKDFQQNKASLEHFLGIGKRLGDIQVRYSRFLSPDITRSLQKIHFSITGLEIHHELHHTKARLPKEMAEALFKDKTVNPEELTSLGVSMALKIMAEAIYNIHCNGIEFWYV